MARALDGFRVLDFTQIIAGPLATRQLALQGAEVIKVEAPGGGDVMRGLMADAEHAARGFSPMFQYLNAGKRSIVLDLKSDEGRRIARTLALRSDVVVENFRPGVMARLGLDAAGLRVEKPDLVCCSISGYGQTGPKIGRPAYDGPMQADSGLMSLNGMPDGEPTRLGIMAIDTLVGAQAATAILAALMRRQQSGEGQTIDISLFDCALHLMAPQVHDWLNRGIVPERNGNGTAAGLPTDNLFHASDGPILITAINETQIGKLFEVLGLSPLGEDARFQSHPARMENREALTAAIDGALGARTAAVWEGELQAAGVPCARVRTVDGVVQDPQVAANGAIAAAKRPEGYDGPEARLLGAGYRADVDGPELRAAPLLGADNAKVLAEIDWGHE